MPVAVHPAASFRRALPAARQPNRSPPFDSSDTLAACRSLCGATRHESHTSRLTLRGGRSSRSRGPDEDPQHAAKRYQTSTNPRREGTPC